MIHSGERNEYLTFCSVNVGARRHHVCNCHHDDPSGTHQNQPSKKGHPPSSPSPRPPSEPPPLSHGVMLSSVQLLHCQRLMCKYLKHRTSLDWIQSVLKFESSEKLQEGSGTSQPPPTPQNHISVDTNQTRYNMWMSCWQVDLLPLDGAVLTVSLRLQSFC